MNKKLRFSLSFAITVFLMILPTWSTAVIGRILSANDFLKQTDQQYSVYDLLIITPRVFRSELLPLVRHKNRIGIRTILVDTDEVYDQMFWQGRDEAEKVKYFIKAAIEHWGVRYVLLVGGRSNQGKIEKYWVPVRYSSLNRPYESYPESEFLSDLYFADIYDENGSFSSWDDNGNGLYGEWPIGEGAVDHPDLIPDVSLGRLPCLNRYELRIVVRKIIVYETFGCAESWFKTMVVVAGDTYPGRTPYYDGEVYTQQGLDLMTGFRPVKLWTSDGSLKHWMNVVSAINKGCGFLWMSGHGNPKSWSTHPPDDNDTWIHGLRMRSLPFLRNRQKLPICITGSGCFNNMFNVSFANARWIWGSRTPYCIGWALMIQRNGGSIATIGATAFSYESPDINLGYGGIEWLDRQFFAEYSLNHTDILGETWSRSVTSVVNACPIDWSDSTIDGSAIIAKNIEQWVLFGDPSLKIGGYR
ncbi:MAG: hypothetical protein JW840_04115 [Candidatus Thermoplasmatota archaeon]|nr:hypothetical protein [Candidatus Thermoplasmatota archaeon]